MRCKAIHPEDHKDPRKAGKRCNSNSACKDKDDPGYGYCYGHALALGKVKAETERRRQQNIAITKEETAAAKGEEDEGAKKSGGAKEWAERLYHDIVGDLNLDFVTMVEEILEEAGIGSLQSKEYDLVIHDLLIMWWMADAKTRIPRRLDDFAKLVSRTTYTVRSWLAEDWFEVKLNQARMKRYKLLSPHVDRETSIQAIYGNKAARAIFYNQVGQLETEDLESFEEMFGEENLRELDVEEGEPSIRLTAQEREVFGHVNRSLSKTKPG